MRWCRACVHTERQLSRLSSSPPIHHHLLLVCCRRTPPCVLVSHPLCAVSCQLCRIHLWCVFHLPSIVAVLRDHVVYQTPSCQAPATGAAPQLHRTVPLKRRPARPHLAATCGINHFSWCCFTCKTCWVLSCSIKTDKNSGVCVWEIVLITQFLFYFCCH